MNTTILPRHGKPIQISQSTFLIRDENGNPFRLAVVISDITERKTAEEALRASEERFRVTFEEAPVGMVIGVGDGVIAKANRAVCRMSGYTEEELVGRHVRDLTHPEDRELSGPFVKKLLAGRSPVSRWRSVIFARTANPFGLRRRPLRSKARTGRSLSLWASWRTSTTANGPRKPCGKASDDSAITSSRD